MLRIEIGATMRTLESQNSKIKRKTIREVPFFVDFPTVGNENFRHFYFMKSTVSLQKF